jgi:hypothetical protein
MSRTTDLLWGKRALFECVLPLFVCLGRLCNFPAALLRLPALMLMQLLIKTLQLSLYLPSG